MCYTRFRDFLTMQIYTFPRFKSILKKRKLLNYNNYKDFAKNKKYKKVKFAWILLGLILKKRGEKLYESWINTNFASICGSKCLKIQRFSRLLTDIETTV